MTYQNKNTQKEQKIIHLIALVIRSNHRDTGYCFHLIGLKNNLKKLAIENKIPPSMMRFVELKRLGAVK